PNYPSNVQWLQANHIAILLPVSSKIKPEIHQLEPIPSVQQAVSGAAQSAIVT
ncbi:hypothetical protein ACLOJK_035142, partial [Asimina triloba]